MLTRKEKRYVDSFLNLAMNFFGALAYGLYMHSFALGVVAYVVLHGLLNLGWSIEYGHDQD